MRENAKMIVSFVF